MGKLVLQFLLSGCLAFSLILVILLHACSVHGGNAIPGLENGPTPFQWLFATGFSGSYNTFGSGTAAGAIGNYGRFVTGGAGSPPHSYK